jgi:hypothetical protein
VVTDAAAKRYDEELDRGMDRIAGELHRLELAHMGEELEAFRVALELDLFDAEDFAG